MKIGFIAEPYEESHTSGMGYSVLQVMRHFLIEGENHEFIFYSSKPINPGLVPGVYTNIIVPKNFVKKFFYFRFFKNRPDALICMLPLLPLWVHPRVKIFPMFHELGSQKIKPQSFHGKVVAFVRDTVLMPLMLIRATHVIAVSHATETDLIKFYNLPRERMTVIHDGYQEWNQFSTDALDIEKRMKPYFFFAGKVKYRKNVHGIVSAFIAFKEHTKVDCKLIIAGDYGGDYHKKMMQELKQHNFDQDVFFLGYVSNPQMYALFTNAIACVFPSINEGFGMPIAESMSLGTPVITSNISATAEIAGDAALLVDPYDIKDISQAMEKIFFDNHLRESLILRGFERAKHFSWQKFAQKYLALIVELSKK